jgi:hypothetical protein
MKHELMSDMLLKWKFRDDEDDDDGRWKLNPSKIKVDARTYCIAQRSRFF